MQSNFNSWELSAGVSLGAAAGGDGAPLTDLSAQLLDQEAPRDAVIPARWIRPPANGAICPWTGLGHAAFYGKLLGAHAENLLILRLKRAGAAKTLPLIWGPSLSRFLDARALHPPTQIKPREASALALRDPRPVGWVRMPKGAAKCAYCGLGRSSLFQLLRSLKGKVRVADLRVGKETRGSRLYHAGDLHRVLIELAIEQSRRAHES